jgi:lysozyme family protein
MSDFNFAVKYVLGNEVLGYGTPRQNPHYEDQETGEISAWGISLKWLIGVQHDATAATVRGLTEAQARNLYQQYWWTPNHFSLIENDRIAAKVFDAAVNMGAGTAIKIMQTVLDVILPGASLNADGVIGPHTAEVVNEAVENCGVNGVLKAFSDSLASRYRNIATANPVHQKDLQGWLARASKLPPETV